MSRLDNLLKVLDEMNDEIKDLEVVLKYNSSLRNARANEELFALKDINNLLNNLSNNKNNI